MEEGFGGTDEEFGVGKEKKKKEGKKERCNSKRRGKEKLMRFLEEKEKREKGWKKDGKG